MSEYGENEIQSEAMLDRFTNFNVK